MSRLTEAITPYIQYDQIKKLEVSDNSVILVRKPQEYLNVKLTIYNKKLHTTKKKSLILSRSYSVPAELGHEVCTEILDTLYDFCKEHADSCAEGWNSTFAVKFGLSTIEVPPIKVLHRRKSVKKSTSPNLVKDQGYFGRKIDVLEAVKTNKERR